MRKNNRKSGKIIIIITIVTLVIAGCLFFAISKGVISFSPNKESKSIPEDSLESYSLMDSSADSFVEENDKFVIDSESNIKQELTLDYVTKRLNDLKGRDGFYALSEDERADAVLSILNNMAEETDNTLTISDFDQETLLYTFEYSNGVEGTVSLRK